MEPPMISEIAEHEEYMGCVRDILCHPVFQSMDQYIQYGVTTCRTHCMQVPCLGYKLCRQLGGNQRSTARAELLRSSFLYNRHTYAKETGQYFHEFIHLKAALANADRYFRLTGEERMIVLKHMWFLTLVPPTSRAGHAATCADKYCSIVETVTRFKYWTRMCLFA